MTLPRSRIDAIKLASHATIILQTDVHLAVLEMFLGICMLVLTGEKQAKSKGTTIAKSCSSPIYRCFLYIKIFKILGT